MSKDQKEQFGQSAKGGAPLPEQRRLAVFVTNSLPEQLADEDMIERDTTVSNTDFQAIFKGFFHGNFLKDQGCKMRYQGGALYITVPEKTHSMDFEDLMKKECGDFFTYCVMEDYDAETTLKRMAKMQPINEHQGGGAGD